MMTQGRGRWAVSQKPKYDAKFLIPEMVRETGDNLGFKSTRYMAWGRVSGTMAKEGRGYPKRSQ